MTVSIRLVCNNTLMDEVRKFVKSLNSGVVIFSVRVSKRKEKSTRLTFLSNLSTTEVTVTNDRLLHHNTTRPSTYINNITTSLQRTLFKPYPHTVLNTVTYKNQLTSPQRTKCCHKLRSHVTWFYHAIRTC